MQRQLQVTADGSHTIFIPALNTGYHSQHGAIGESMHVFIDAGLKQIFHDVPSGTIQVLEIGYGTGLNALLTLSATQQAERTVRYMAIEKFPLKPDEFLLLNHGALLNMQSQFKSLHEAAWEQHVAISKTFTLYKTILDLPMPITAAGIHCIYHDAFAPDISPLLWTADFFRGLYETLAPGGILVTYCSKSVVRKAMAAAGFRVTKIQGPWGKREMVRAYK